MQTSQSQYSNEYADYNQHIQLKLLILADGSAYLPIFRLPALRNPKSQTNSNDLKQVEELKRKEVKGF
jgi:hypothetical protein